MLTYDLSQRGSIPLYEFLYQKIKEDIITGNLAAGEKLPSKRAFARHLTVSFVTVENAYEQLLMEGYIYAKERKGYYVEKLPLQLPVQEKTEKQENKRVYEAEPEYFMDFKANRISLSKFPASTWSKYMREALSLGQDILYKPVSYKGLYELRVAIADHLWTNRGMKVDPGQIIVGAGTEYLYSRLFQLLGRDCVFAMEDPGYAKIPKISASYGNRWIHIPLDDYGLRVDLLSESDADVVHVSPANHFPTGIVMSISRRLELLEWVAKIPKRYIIEDDYDSEFRYNRKRKVIPPLFAQDTAGKVIYTNTFSKTLVPTLRISYMVLPPKLMKRFEETMSFYSCTVSSFEQYTLARFIEEGHFERHISRMRKYYSSIRTQVLTAIKNSPLAKISRVEEHDAGTHFLLIVQTKLTIKEIKRAAYLQTMSLSFYSEYSNEPETPGICKLVINYASIRPEKIQDVVERLCRIFSIV